MVLDKACSAVNNKPTLTKEVYCDRIKLMLLLKINM